jgi:O-antigen ligase
MTLLVEIIVLIVLGLLVIIKPRLSLGLFLFFYILEKYAGYFPFIDDIVSFTIYSNQFLIIMLAFRAFTQHKNHYFRNKEIKIFYKLLFCFVGWSCLSFFWTDNPIIVKEELFRLFKFLVMLYAIYGTIESPRTLQRVLIVWFSLMGLKSILQFSIFISTGGVLPMGAGVALIPILILLSLKSKRKYIKLLFVFLLFIILSSFIISPMRRGFLSLLIVLLVTVYYNFNGKMLPYIFILLIGSFFLNNQFSTEYFSYRLRSMQYAMQNFDTSWTGRETLWPIALEQVKERLFTGYGYGSNEKVISISSYQLHSKFIENVRVHNTYLKILLETGIIGLIIYIGFVIILIKLLYKCYIGNKFNNQVLSILYFGLFASWVATAVISFFGYSGYLDKDLWIKAGFALVGIKILHPAQFVDQRREIEI